ncbi:fasciclin domain family protein [Phlyctema vagabunda]|uniref:Fasciclin domain family protein n=1 Tax=Phlyctema vagabunda TaxID=108571 RepID=A0ABR4PI74_9HELO
MAPKNPIEYFDTRAWLSPHAIALPPGPVAHPELPKESGITVWQTLQGDAKFTQFANLISSFPDLISILDGKEECTLFAIPDEVLAKPNKALNGSLLQDLDASEVSDVLRFHISPQYMPSTYMSTAPNLPVLYSPATLNGVMLVNCKRLSEQDFLLQNTIHTTEVDELCSNGIIHVVDDMLLPAPSSLEILSRLPEHDFSVFQAGLPSTGLSDEVTKTRPKGGILFIPTNAAFERLGRSAMQFLLADTSTSRACLAVLLRYHVVLNETFYTNIHFRNPALSYDYEHAQLEGAAARTRALRHIAGTRRRTVTSWLGPRVVLDLERDAGRIEVAVNGHPILVRDGNARDGVLHILDCVLVPPSPRLTAGEDVGLEWARVWSGEELRARLLEWL